MSVFVFQQHSTLVLPHHVLVFFPRQRTLDTTHLCLGSSRYAFPHSTIKSCSQQSAGHEVVATIAQMHLHPSVMPKLCDILDYDGECHLAPVAAWADRIRRIPKYSWTGPLHYINAVDDYPSGVCAFPGSNGWGGRTHINLLHGIRNTTYCRTLRDIAGRDSDGTPTTTTTTTYRAGSKMRSNS